MTIPRIRAFCLRWLQRISVVLAALALGYWLLPKPDLLPPDWEYSRTVLDRDGEVIFLTTTSDGKLRLPLIGAPMFIVSGPELVAAQCKAGIVGSFPALNARPQEALVQDFLYR